VRSFPGAAPPRRVPAALAGLLVLGVLVLPPTSPAQARPGPSGDPDRGPDRASQVRGQVADAAQSLDETSRRAARAAQLVREARAGLVDARSAQRAAGVRLDRAQGRSDRLAGALTRWEGRLADAAAELARGRRAVAAQREQVASSVRTTVTRGAPQLMALGSLMEAGSTEDLTRRVAAEEAMVGRQTRAFDELTVAERGLARQRRDARTATEEVRDRRRAAARSADRVQRAYDAATATADAVADLVAQGRDARRAAESARRADAAELERLRVREAEILQQVRAATAGEQGGYAGPDLGYLTPPALAPVTSPFGWRVHPIYGYRSLHDGTDFGVACGTPLAAAAGGTVVAAYTDKIYGKRLYLAVGQVNGASITVVYNHLSSYAVGLGDRVARGQTVALSGDTGWSTGCHLHLTVLRDGVAVDPLRYL